MNVHLTDELVQAVRDAVDIVDIAGEMTRLKKAGKRYKGLCPFHKEKTPSFGIDPVQGLYYCFGCGAGGDAIRLFQESTGDDFRAAIEALARRYGIPLPQAPEHPGVPPRRDLGAVLEAAQKHFRRHLERSDFACRYLDDRRISSELRTSYGLGYAPDGWRLLLEALRDRFPEEDLLATGLVARSDRTDDLYDRFRQRLIFPIHAPSGHLVGFGGRTLGDDRAKYVNTSGTEYFHKGNLLYGFHLAKRELRDGGKALLVEGYFDVIGAAACGFSWAVAGMGTALTAEQARLLARYCDEVVVAYDGDEAGEKAHRRALSILLAAGLTVQRARFPAGHDPDSLRLEDGPQAVREVVESAADAVATEIDRLAPGTGEYDPQTTARAARTIGELLRPIRNGIVRHAYGRRAAERLGIPLEMLTRAGRRSGRRAAARNIDDGPMETRQAAREVRSAEEKALCLLLGSETATPCSEELPPAEVFFDPECRNIYAAFCALYRDGGGVPPVVSDIVSSLSRESDGAIDRIARLLLQESDSPDGGLRATFDELLRRWHKQRGSRLKREIQQAERQGDQIRLAQLLEEKKSLSRSLHPEMTGKLW